MQKIVKNELNMPQGMDSVINRVNSGMTITPATPKQQPESMLGGKSNAGSKKPTSVIYDQVK